MQKPIEEKLPQPGALVRVRSRQYLVEELTPPPDALTFVVVDRDYVLRRRQER